MRDPYVTSALALLRRAIFGAALALAAFVVVGVGSGSAQAGVALPSLAAPSAALDSIGAPAPQAENVRWICGPWRCFWRPNWRNWYVPPYARGWGPPVRPTCYWRRGWGGGWVHVCP